MRTHDRVRKAIELHLETSQAAGWDTDEQLARAAQRIAEAEELFRRLAEPLARIR